jgi:hypothetical protein
VISIAIPDASTNTNTNTNYTLGIMHQPISALDRGSDATSSTIVSSQLNATKGLKQANRSSWKT